MRELDQKPQHEGEADEAGKGDAEQKEQRAGQQRGDDEKALLLLKTRTAEGIGLIGNHREAADQRGNQRRVQIDQQQLLRGDVDKDIVVCLAHLRQIGDKGRGEAQTDAECNKQQDHTDQNPVSKLLQMAGDAHAAVGIRLVL